MINIFTGTIFSKSVNYMTNTIDITSFLSSSYITNLEIFMFLLVHVVLHRRGIAPTFLKFDSWSRGAGFYSYYIQQGNKSDKERKIVKIKLSFMLKKRFNTFLKRLGQFPFYRFCSLQSFLKIIKRLFLLSVCVIWY